MPLRSGQPRTREKVLMNSDRPIDLAPSSQCVSQRYMRFEGLAVHFQRADKVVNGTIRAAVEEVVKPLVVGIRETPGVFERCSYTASSKPPATGYRTKEQCKKQRIIHA
jgi:hypothetical protein